MTIFWIPIAEYGFKERPGSFTPLLVFEEQTLADMILSHQQPILKLFHTKPTPKKHPNPDLFLRVHFYPIGILVAGMSSIITEYLQFFTATNLEWKKLLQPDKYKDIVINSLRFLVKYNRVRLYGFVIMWNHIHLIWQMRPLIDPKIVQRDFLKYTAQRIKSDLQRNHPLVLESFRVDTTDRAYQLWERNPLSVELRTEKLFRQKLEYIHRNPVRAGICKLPEEYKYSSALFYEMGVDNWGFLTHYND